MFFFFLDITPNKNVYMFRTIWVFQTVRERSGQFVEYKNDKENSGSLYCTYKWCKYNVNTMNIVYNSFMTGGTNLFSIFRCVFHVLKEHKLL